MERKVQALGTDDTSGQTNLTSAFGYLPDRAESDNKWRELEPIWRIAPDNHTARAPLRHLFAAVRPALQHPASDVDRPGKAVQLLQQRKSVFRIHVSLGSNGEQLSVSHQLTEPRWLTLCGEDIPNEV